MSASISQGIPGHTDFIKLGETKSLKEGLKPAIEKKILVDTQGRVSLAVAIPAYNEEIAIGSIVLRSLKYTDKVAVIDDGSPDKTTEISR